MGEKFPVDLVLVRHGESEGNFSQERAKGGDHSLWTTEFRNRHTSRYRLTERGRLQAIAAGEFIRKNIYHQFERYYASEYTRAMETAGLLGFKRAHWFVEFYLREQDNGVFQGKTKQERKKEYTSELERRKRDRFYFQPPGGESIANSCLRVERWLSDLKASSSGLTVIAVCHGNIIYAIRVVLEKMKQEEFANMKRDSMKKIHYGQIIHYTRRNPENNRMSKNFGWMRSICPWDISKSSNKWIKITRPVWTNEELFSSAEKIPRLINNTEKSFLEFKQLVEKHSAISAKVAEHPEEHEQDNTTQVVEIID